MSEKLVPLVTAPDQLTADIWCDILQKEGVPAFAKFPANGLYLGLLFGSAAPIGCWVMVPEEHLKKATTILEPILHGEPPSPDRE